MKLLIAFLLLPITSGLFSQPANQYFFKDIGLTIALPSGYKIDDSAAIQKNNEKAYVYMTADQQAVVKKGSIVTLLSARIERATHIGIRISSIPMDNEEQWERITDAAAISFYNVLKKSTTMKFDSASSKTIIDHKAVKKFTMICQQEGRFIQYVHLFRHINDFTVLIEYIANNQERAIELNKVVQQATFVN